MSEGILGHQSGADPHLDETFKPVPDEMLGACEDDTARAGPEAGTAQPSVLRGL